MDPVESLYREHAPAVLGYLRASGTPDPEDRLGDVFLHVARDLPRFRDRDDPDAVRRWLFTIARHRVIDAARRSRRRPVIVVDVVPERPDTTSAEGPLDVELLAALLTLTTEQREVVALRFVADLALEDVARITGRTVGAVKALQHRALDSLRAAVSPVQPPAL